MARPNRRDIFDPNEVGASLSPPVHRIDIRELPILNPESRV